MDAQKVQQRSNIKHKCYLFSAVERRITNRLRLKKKLYRHFNWMQDRGPYLRLWICRIFGHKLASYLSVSMHYLDMLDSSVSKNEGQLTGRVLVSLYNDCCRHGTLHFLTMALMYVEISIYLNESFDPLLKYPNILPILCLENKISMVKKNCGVCSVSQSINKSFP